MRFVTRPLAKTFHRLRGWCAASLDGESFRCNCQNWSFWKRATQGSWEPETFRILGEFLRADSIYWDVGAWIGPTVLYAARKCRQVICFEPDPVAFERLLTNIRLNRLTNVLPLHLALSESDGIRRMTGSDGKLGKSSTSFLHAAQHRDGIATPSFRLDTLRRLLDLNEVHFIKMDVEGGEFNLLPTMFEFLRETRPILYLSVHAPYLAAEERRPQLERLAELFSIYDRCYDSRRTPVSAKVLAEPEALETFTSFLFVPVGVTPGDGNRAGTPA